MRVVLILVAALLMPSGAALLMPTGADLLAPDPALAGPGRAGPARAEPGPTPAGQSPVEALGPAPARSGTGNHGAPPDEGGTPLLRDVLESTGRGYVQARVAVTNSRNRQRKLDADLRLINERLAALAPEVGEVASGAYRTGRIGPVMVLLNSASPDQFLERSQGLEVLTQRNDARLNALHMTRARAARAKAAIDAEVAEENRLLDVMARQKRDAERALQQVGGRSTGGFVSATSPVARQSPRNGDGSWPRQSCSVEDPTTGGCVTPRMLFALNEAKRVGFTRFVSCYRPSGPYEHPKGRACDFSPQRQGFGGDATGSQRLYGNNLAAFFVRNADKLGVLYVIWYRQIWLPATGWKSYGGAYGDPSSDHTNHVHLSVL